MCLDASKPYRRGDCSSSANTLIRSSSASQAPISKSDAHHPSTLSFLISTFLTRPSSLAFPHRPVPPLLSLLPSFCQLRWYRGGAGQRCACA